MGILNTESTEKTQPHGLKTNSESTQATGVIQPHEHYNVNCNQVLDLQSITLDDHNYCQNPKRKCLSIYSLNVCSIRSKLDIEDFTNEISKYDIVSFCETKCDNADIEFVENAFKKIGFKAFLKNRHNLTCYRSGGILIALKESLLNKCKLMETKANNILILKIDKRLLNFDKHIVLFTTYIPPYGTKYSNVDLFDDLSNELLNYDSDDYYHLICGDLNAHTNCQSDIVQFNDVLCEEVEIDEQTRHHLDTHKNMLSLNIPVKRYSVDTFKDNGGYGKALLELCVGNMVCIFNGRVGFDREKGKATTTDGAVIDYMIGSPFLLSRVKAFEILDYDPIFSDKHCPIICKLYGCENNEQICDNDSSINIINNEVSHENSRNKNHKKIKWNTDKKQEFIDNIDKCKVNYLLENCDNISVQQITSELNNLVIESARNTFVSNQHSNFKKKNIGKKKKYKYDSYNSECRSLRQQYHRAKHRNNVCKCEINHDDMIRKSKEFKKKLNEIKKTNTKNLIAKLRNLKSRNAKEYWQLIRKTPKSKIPLLIGEFYEHFKQLSQEMNDNQMNDESGSECSELGEKFDTTELNCPITDTEISKCIKKLKNGKSSGVDEMINEYIKSTEIILLPLYVKLFNKILDEGKIPEEWVIGLIVPIYKNKGDKMDTNNYRGITLLSCMGKLFTAVLNTRLYNFCEVNRILIEAQTGFRNGYSTIDHIFLLKQLVEYYKSQNKKLFCCFIDYRKAFDTVGHEELWYKLLNCGINGKILQIVKNLYANAKSCVFMNGEKSEFFISKRGVRQGENLSPLLFSLFVNDLEEFLSQQGCDHLNPDSSMFDKFFKLLVLMYADDTIIMSDSKEGLQKALNCLDIYCEKWGLQINSSKTKVTVFSNRKVPTSRYSFTYKGEPLEIVEDFKYLGLKINYNGNFKKALIELKNQASRAMYSLISKCRRLKLPIDIQLELFDRTVLPIMLYACEVWGTENFEILELLYRKFLKFALNVHGRSCNAIVYGELGQFPLKVLIKQRMLNYWARMINGKEGKLSKTMYLFLLKLYNEGVYKAKWLDTIKSFLDNCGMSMLWQTQSISNINWFKNKIKQIIKDQYIQEWHADLEQMTSCDVYIQFKTSFKLETYLKCDKIDSNLKIFISKLRCNNSRIPKVVGRYKKIPRENRHCSFCDSKKVGDELHVLLECTDMKIKSFREKYIPQYFYENPSMAKCIELIKSDDINTLRKLGIFLKNVLPLFK